MTRLLSILDQLHRLDCFAGPHLLDRCTEGPDYISFDQTCEGGGQTELVFIFGRCSFLRVPLLLEEGNSLMQMTMIVTVRSELCKAKGQNRTLLFQLFEALLERH